jgi:hypothetical protein
LVHHLQSRFNSSKQERCHKKTQKKQLAQPWSTPRPCAYIRKKYFWISKQLDISALLFRGFLANSFSRHTTDSGSALLCSTYFPGPVTNYDFRWPYFPSWRLHSDGIAHQAISDFIIITTGRLSYLSSFGSAVSRLQTAKIKFFCSLGDEDDDKIHDAEEEKDHDYKPHGLTNTITITTFS